MTEKVQIATQLISEKQRFDTVGGKTTKTINPAMYTGSTVLFDNCEDLRLANAGEYPGIVYGTDRLPPQRSFEKKMEELEGSALTRAFPSGISAIINTLLTFTSSGDHVLVCDNVYGPTANFCSKILRKYNIAIDFIPPDIGSDIVEYLQSNTRLIYLESPGSNTFELQDIPAITKQAIKRNIITVLDNTWATPLFLNPFALGVDIIVQSVTKYISGHSDVLLGTVSVNQRYADEFDTFYQVMETFAPPQDCYLALRGLKTLPVRLAHHQQAALMIAKWLEQQPFVERVLHPALPSHPQHHLWQRDFSGSSGLFAFLVDKKLEGPLLPRFIDSLDLFGIGYSWGGYKSLVTIGSNKRRKQCDYTNRTVIRLNIGLEDPADLINDLKKGFRIFH